MLNKILGCIWALGIAICVYWIASNNGIPLGFDHGYYKQFTHFYGLLDGNMNKLSTEFQYQFEPFSGTFLYVMKEFLGKDLLYNWGYLGIYILTSLSFLFLGKQGKYYTLGSLLGGFLFFFSSVQYMNFSGSLGKQLFATFFLILAIRHVYKLGVSIPLFIACISLHRLTGFVAILYIIFTIMTSKKNMSFKTFFLIPVLIGILSYLPTFDIQVLPFLKSFVQNPERNLLIMHRSGAGFSYKDFWYHVFPMALVLFISIIHICQQKKKKRLLSPHFFVFIIIALLFIFRGIAYNRLGSFFELFLLIIISRELYYHIHKKWIITLLIIQLILWIPLAKDKHKPFSTPEEHKSISSMLFHVPKNVSIINQSSPYRAILTGYSTLDFRGTYNILTKGMSKDEQTKLKFDKTFLCEKLKRFTQPVFIYSGALRDYTSEKNNPCLSVVKIWDNGAQLSQFMGEKM